MSKSNFFDTIYVKNVDCAAIKKAAESKGMNFCYHSDDTLSISFGETHTIEDVNYTLETFKKLKSKLDAGEYKSDQLAAVEVDNKKA